MQKSYHQRARDSLISQDFVSPFLPCLPSNSSITQSLWPYHTGPYKEHVHVLYLPAFGNKIDYKQQSGLENFISYAPKMLVTTCICHAGHGGQNPQPQPFWMPPQSRTVFPFPRPEHTFHFSKLTLLSAWTSIALDLNTQSNQLSETFSSLEEVDRDASFACQGAREYQIWGVKELVESHAWGFHPKDEDSMKDGQSQEKVFWSSTLILPQIISLFFPQRSSY